MKIAKLKSLKSQSEPITVQSVIRLVELENRQNFIEMIQSIEGESFLKRWLTQLKGNVIIVQKVESYIEYQNCDVFGDMGKI